MIQNFSGTRDAERALQALRKLQDHDLSRWALTGGLAVEIHHRLNGSPPSTRRLNDIDFVVPAFDCIPETLANEYLFRHVHPLAPPGKILLQLVDPDAALRIDLFRARGATMSRAIHADLPSGSIQLVSIEDLVAATARLVMDLAEGVPVEAKHAHDYTRLVTLIDPSQAEAAWQDHRKPAHPSTFRDANTRIADLIACRRDLLTTADYSQDTTYVCPRCVSHTCFRLVDPEAMIALLGYC